MTAGTLCVSVGNQKQSVQPNMLNDVFFPVYTTTVSRFFATIFRTAVL